MNRLTRAVHIHTFPHCDVLSVADPTEILPPGRSPKQHLTPGHVSLGTPAHTTQYLRDAALEGGRGWKGEGPTRPRTPRSGLLLTPWALSPEGAKKSPTLWLVWNWPQGWLLPQQEQ